MYLYFGTGSPRVHKKLVYERTVAGPRVAGQTNGHQYRVGRQRPDRVRRQLITVQSQHGQRPKEWLISVRVDLFATNKDSQCLKKTKFLKTSKTLKSS